VLRSVDVQYGRWPRVERIILSVDQADGVRAPSFAVVIPVHNASATLKETFDCILPQLGNRDRLCAIENGSSDDSWHQLQTYREHPLVRLIQIPKSGASEARNMGVESATEDYILFCDADDTWAPHKMAIYRSLILQRPDVDFACDMSVSWKGKNFESLGLLGPRLLGKALWRFPNMFYALLFRTSFFATSSTAFKRAGVPSGWFSPGLTHTQDFEAWCRWAAHVPNPTVMFIDTPLTNYRFEAGLSKQHDHRMANTYHIVCRYAARLPRWQRYLVRAIAILRLMRHAVFHRAVGAGLHIWLKTKPHPSIRS
jgi:glycosyltransferase involved in cell wall biosynthesis